MRTAARRAMALYVDKINQQWIVQDLDGCFWSLPPSARPWEERQPFNPAECMQLEPVPGHYKHLLGVPSAPREHPTDDDRAGTT